MGMKLGFMNSLTKKESLSDEEFGCIQALFQAFEKTGADFTNTFRTLSNLSLQDQNTSVVLEEILKNTAPVNSFIKTKESKFSPEMLKKIKQIMEKDPAFLKYIHLDPKKAKDLIYQDESVQKMKQISQQERDADNKQIWQTWLD
mmetsp:Transcript_32089/g.31400  ORF Transcript_32089/g.31400 Transcript_32089/m.31400 type:complete len:145 (+) Transcript_32089:1109-1543(+)